MRVPIRYPALLWTAVVATAFCLTVGALMAFDFVARGKYELFDTPEYLALKQQLRDRPGDAELQQAIREMDLRMRDEYFRNRQFMATGVHLLIGGAVVALVAARWAAAVRGTTFQPAPLDTAVDEETRAQRVARWATVGVVAVVAATLASAGLYSEPVTPVETAQLTAGPQAKPTDAAAVPSDSVSAANVQPVPDSQRAPDAEPAPDIQPTRDVKPEPAADQAADMPPYEAYLQQWPRFRGPTGSGVSPVTDVPTAWSVPDNTGIVWKTPVPLPGPNSPVVWQQRVLLSGATADEQAVFCFDANSGQLQWRHDFTATKPADGKELEVMDATGFAAPTMATDGVRAYAIFATGDVVAITLEGDVLWRKNLGVPKNHYGHASSLATYRDLLIIQLDQGQKEDGLSRLLALRGATGEVAWEAKREVPCSWSSPIVVEHGGRWMVITCVNPWVIAYAPEDGSELWRANCLRGEVGPSPVCVDGVVYAANETGGMAAVRADGTGDVTETHILWTTDIDVPDVCSPLVTDKYVLLVTHGLLACFDRTEGETESREPLWEEELDEVVSSSPSQVGNLVYLFSEDGKAWIVEPQADACKRIGECPMDESIRTSPAFAPGRIYVRGQDHLFCIGTN